MLKSLAEDQELVWNQAFGNRQRSQYDQECTPTNVKKEIEDMLEEVETINDSVRRPT